MANLIQRATRGAIAYALFGPRSEYRSSLENPQTPLSFPAEWLLDIFNGGRTDSGIRVSELTALQVSTVMSCVNVISRGVGMLPLHVYERHIQSKRAAKTRAHEHYLYDVLRHEPNCEMTSSTFFKTFMCHALLWGNGYAEITRRNNGQVHSIWPRNPYLMVPKRILRKEYIDGSWHPQGTLVYETTECFTEAINEDGSLKTSGGPRTILAENVLHVPGLTLDGRIGQSTIWMARQIIGLALASEKYSAKFFGNGAVPRGILEVPEMPEEKALEELRRQWHEAHGGENAHKVAVMTAGMKFTPIAFNAEQSQLLETRKFQRGEIAAMFNVPGHMVGDTQEKGKSNVEQSSIEFLTYTLMPWLIAIEQEFERKVFPDTGQTANKFFPKFDTHLLKYPDAAARTALFNGGKQWGWLNTNDIHEFEDMNPVTDGSGEKYWMPTNMQDASDPVTLGANAQADYDKAHPTPTPPMPGVVPHAQPGAVKVPAMSTPAKRSEERDKDEKGPGSDPHGGSADKTTAEHASAILDLHNANGGSTYNLKQGSLAGKDMYAVAANPEAGKIIDGQPSAKDIASFIDKNSDLLSDSSKSVGTWFNKDDGKTYLDVSTTLKDRAEAIKLGKSNDQIAIYSLKDGIEIKTGGTGEVPKRSEDIARISRTFYASFNDAIGRVAHRSAASLTDIQRIFRPLLVAMIETFETGATSEQMRAIEAYCKVLHSRSAEWKLETRYADADNEVRLAAQHFLSAAGSRGSADEQRDKDEHGYGSDPHGGDAPKEYTEQELKDIQTEYDKNVQAAHDEYEKQVVTSREGAAGRIIENCNSLGVGSARVTVTNDRMERQIGDNRFFEAAHAETQTGNLVFHIPDMPTMNLNSEMGVCVHEVEHLKFESAYKALTDDRQKLRDLENTVINRVHAADPQADPWRDPAFPTRISGQLKEEFQKDFPVVDRFQKAAENFNYDPKGTHGTNAMIKADGCTDYSKKYWDAMSKQQTLDGYPVNTKMAYHETVAEIARLKATDPERYKTGVAPVWKAYVKAVDKTAKERGF